MTAKLSIPPHNLAFIRHWHWKANERHRSNNTTGCSKWPSSSGSPLLMDCVACTPASWLRPVANCRKKKRPSLLPFQFLPVSAAQSGNVLPVAWAPNLTIPRNDVTWVSLVSFTSSRKYSAETVSGISPVTGSLKRHVDRMSFDCDARGTLKAFLYLLVILGLPCLGFNGFKS